MIDLHIHSTASDGSLTPEETVARAAHLGLSAIALTDHDTIAGLPKALEAAERLGIPLVPGMEMSCVWDGWEIHLLGYFADPASPGLNEDLQWFRQFREERNAVILDNLAEDGILLTETDLTEGQVDTLITRVHFARALVRRGFSASVREAFDAFLVPGGRYVPPKDGITPERVMALYRKNSIWPALAHPLEYGMEEGDLLRLLKELKALGLRGLEVWHPSHSWQGISALKKLAREEQLLPTGGSDFHGSPKPDIEMGVGRGNLKIFEKILDEIREDYEKLRRLP